MAKARLALLGDCESKKVKSSGSSSVERVSKNSKGKINEERDSESRRESGRDSESSSREEDLEKEEGLQVTHRNEDVSRYYDNLPSKVKHEAFGDDEFEERKSTTNEKAGKKAGKKAKKTKKSKTTKKPKTTTTTTKAIASTTTTARPSGVCDLVGNAWAKEFQIRAVEHARLYKLHNRGSLCVTHRCARLVERLRIRLAGEIRAAREERRKELRLIRCPGTVPPINSEVLQKTSSLQKIKKATKKATKKVIKKVIKRLTHKKKTSSAAPIKCGKRDIKNWNSKRAKINSELFKLYSKGFFLF